MKEAQDMSGMALGKGKVEGSIPFGSTIPFKDLASGKDMTAGSNEPAISDFIARGGSIKRGPTLVSEGVRFWSPCSQPELGPISAPPADTIHQSMNKLFGPNPGRDAYNKRRAAEFRAKCRIVQDMVAKGMTRQEIIKATGFNERRITGMMKGVYK